MHSLATQPPCSTEARPGFSSFKTPEPLFYPHRWHRDALVQMTLNPAVIQLAPSPVRLSDLPDGITAAFVAIYETGPVLLGLADRPLAAPGTLGDLPFVVLTRREVLAEPRATTARMIWSTRKTQVSPGDRIRALRRLSKSPSSLPLAALEDAITSPQGDPINAILALACAGLIAIDATSHLTPETVVWRPNKSVPVGTSTYCAPTDSAERRVGALPLT